MAKPLRHDVHRHPGAQKDRRVRVPELVECQPRETRCTLHRLESLGDVVGLDSGAVLPGEEQAQVVSPAGADGHPLLGLRPSPRSERRHSLSVDEDRGAGAVGPRRPGDGAPAGGVVSADGPAAVVVGVDDLRLAGGRSGCVVRLRPLSGVAARAGGCWRAAGGVDGVGCAVAGAGASVRGDEPVVADTGGRRER